MNRPIKTSDSHYRCVNCGDTVSEVDGKGNCVDCKVVVKREVAREKTIADRKVEFNAIQELAREVAKRGRSSAMSPEFFDQFSKELGGAKGLGERLADTFKRLHGDGLSAAEQQFFTRDEKTIQRYWQMLSTFMQQQDRMNAVDISSLSDEELQATLTHLARELVAKDASFRQHIIRVAVDQDRKLISELAEEAGLIGTSVDALSSVPPEDDDTEGVVEPEEF